MADPVTKSLVNMLNKVPEVTLVFWIIKIMSTTVGETGADYLAVQAGLGTAITAGIMGVWLFFALTLQTQDAAVCTVELLAYRGSRQHCWYTDYRRTHRRTRDQSLHEYRDFRDWAGSGLLHVVSLRANAVDPHDLYTASRTFLLARYPRYFRTRHRRRRPRDGSTRTRIPAWHRYLRPCDRRDRPCLLSWCESGLDVLDCVHPDSPSRCGHR